MGIQRCVLYLTKKYLLNKCILQPSSLQYTYSEIIRKYSNDVKNRRYTDRHEWVVVDKDIGKVGITNYAQESLGDIVFAQLPEPECVLKAGDECGALESVKAASEIYSPVSGTVTEINKVLEKKPGLINSSCYDQGWLYKIKLTNIAEINELMTDEQYETFLKTDIEKDH